MNIFLSFSSGPWKVFLANIVVFCVAVTVDVPEDASTVELADPKAISAKRKKESKEQHGSKKVKSKRSRKKIDDEDD